MRRSYEEEGFDPELTRDGQRQGGWRMSRMTEWQTPSSAGSPRKGIKGVSAARAVAEETLQLYGSGKSSLGSLKRMQGYSLDAGCDTTGRVVDVSLWLPLRNGLKRSGLILPGLGIQQRLTRNQVVSQERDSA